VADSHSSAALDARKVVEDCGHDACSGGYPDMDGDYSTHTPTEGACVPCISSALQGAYEAGKRDRDEVWIERCRRYGARPPEDCNFGGDEPVVDFMVHEAVKRGDDLSPCPQCEAAYEAGARSEREATLPALELLMGGPGWRQHYECGHGVPVVDYCPAKGCASDVLRAVLRRSRG
jgi:hypothetical protein